MEIVNIILLWTLNIIGIGLWAFVFLLSIESFKIFKRTSWVIWDDWKYWINWIWLISALCVVFYRVDDIWMQKTINYIWIRTLASVLVPIGIMLHYHLKGVTSSVWHAIMNYGKELENG